jgi:hypothetical protein
MTERILSRQFHGTDGTEAWRVLPDGAFASIANPRSLR